MADTVPFRNATEGWTDHGTEEPDSDGISMMVTTREMQESGVKGSDNCPNCDSANSDIIQRRERPALWFSIRAPRRCLDCGGTFVPRSSGPLRVVAAICGLLMFLSCVVPLLRDMISTLPSKGFSGRVIVDACFEIVTAIFGVWVVVIAVRSGISRSLPNVQSEDGLQEDAAGPSED